MSNRTLADEVITLIQSESNNNQAPEKATITKVYADGYVDVEIENGLKLIYVPCGNPKIIVGDVGVIVYLDGDVNTPFFIVNTVKANKWVKTVLNSYADLFVNEYLGICELRYSRTFKSATANTLYSWHSKLIPSKYAPSSQVQGAIDYFGILIVTSDGSVKGRFTNGWSSNIKTTGSVMWNYEV